ncbi:MAG: hypothetical protein LRY68_03165, partial [Sulfurospirillum sp.]|nr:hypothetical protein [Sulfurospirillum sp.]
GFMIQMLGLQMFTWVGYGYNATWWFMSLIVVLYAIFPLMHFFNGSFWVVVFSGVCVHPFYAYSFGE